MEFTPISDDCEYDPDEEPSQWIPGASEEKETKGDKPPKGKKEKKAKKQKHDRANPDFEDMPGYEGLAFKGSKEIGPPNQPKPLSEKPVMKFENLAQLSKDDCKAAMKKFVDDQFCYGKKPAEEMEILSVKGITALHYVLETFTEARQTKKKKKPYKGGHIDGPDKGDAPGPWAVPIKYKKPYHDDKIKKEVPHTAKVKKCKDCKGRGWEPCEDCDGWGRVECETCDGSGTTMGTDEEGNGVEMPCTMCSGGMQMCTDCGGDGRVTCEDCEGYRKLKCFIQLKVKFNNHKDEYVLETTDLPDELIATVGGNEIYKEEAPLVHPIDNYPISEINEHSQKFVSNHAKKWPKEFIHMQKHVLRGVPVTECEYKWEDTKTRFWVYGKEKKIWAPDYPQQCCCGCSVL